MPQIKAERGFWPKLLDLGLAKSTLKFRELYTHFSSKFQLQQEKTEKKFAIKLQMSRYS